MVVHPYWNIDWISASLKYLRRDLAAEPSNIWETVSYRDIDGVDTGTKEEWSLFSRLINDASSFDEARVFEDWQGTLATSTIRGFFQAKKDGLSLHTLDPADLSIQDIYDLVDSLNLGMGPGAISSIKAAMVNDYTVIVPESPVEMGDIDGTKADIWLQQKPGGTGWFFGSYNGGWSSKYSNLIKSISSWFKSSSQKVVQTFSTASKYISSINTNGGSLGNTIDTGKNTVNATASWLGDPVNVVTGEFYHDELPDISLK